MKILQDVNQSIALRPLTLVPGDRVRRRIQNPGCRLRGRHSLALPDSETQRECYTVDKFGCMACTISYINTFEPIRPWKITCVFKYLLKSSVLTGALLRVVYMKLVLRATLSNKCFSGLGTHELMQNV